MVVLNPELPLVVLNARPLSQRQTICAWQYGIHSLKGHVGCWNLSITSA
jgi:hypothetical protein